LHQNRSLGHSLCYIDDNAFLGIPAAVMVVVVDVMAVIAAVPADFSAQDNYVAR
jgi:carbonic anhydrase/acetyltransferase-like protein (isoleucine patch superfamily)